MNRSIVNKISPICTPTVLYIDDEPFNSVLFKLHLKPTFNIISATNGAAGLRWLHKLMRRPSLVLCELYMPKMNGIEFVHRGKLLFPEVSFFLTSSRSMNEKVLELLNESAIKGFYQKPFNYEFIKERLLKISQNSIQYLEDQSIEY